MKHLRKFENTKFPGIKDYVIYMNNISKDRTNESILQFLENSVGLITYASPSYFEVKYNNIPENIKDWFSNGEISLAKETVRFATPTEIEHFEILNKYNI